MTMNLQKDKRSLSAGMSMIHNRESNQLSMMATNLERNSVSPLVIGDRSEHETPTSY